MNKRNDADASLLARITPHLKVHQVKQGQVLAETQQPVQKVYFPHGGIISNVVELTGGEAVETAMIGRDGAYSR
jgi:hypothetical protein